MEEATLQFKIEQTNESSKLAQKQGRKNKSREKRKEQIEERNACSTSLELKAFWIGYLKLQCRAIKVRGIKSIHRIVMCARQELQSYKEARIKFLNDLVTVKGTKKKWLATVSLMK
ncbi:hypothetical protein ACH5RR_025993 [Cinchona calisaya]|uniref:Uncharacterized protein n=1 Tax=Cinchona calisaya TaxID=153742 RepID=A0ABD2Z189_9GENT